MNKTKIEWTDYSWNPVTGCLRGCNYCYAQRIATRFRGSKVFPQGFTPTFYPGRLREPERRRKPSMIFVCSMGDLFGSWVPRGWIKEVLETVERCPQHIFQFLTKDPQRLSGFSWPSNCWIGVTAETPDLLRTRKQGLMECDACIRFASLEPIFAPFKSGDLRRLDWIIVGPQTGPGAARPAEFLPHIQSVIESAKSEGIPVFVKPASGLLGPQEFPKEKR